MNSKTCLTVLEHDDKTRDYKLHRLSEQNTGNKFYPAKAAVVFYVINCSTVIMLLS